jgi:hypothetical protein
LSVTLSGASLFLVGNLVPQFSVGAFGDVA